MAEIYVDPMTQVKFQGIQQKLRDLEEEKTMRQLRNRQSAELIGKNLLQAYQTSNLIKTKELMGAKIDGQNIYEMSPEYRDASFLKKPFFTPGGKVQPTEFGAQQIKAGTFTDIQGPETIRGQVGESFRNITDKGKNIFEAGKTKVGQPVMPGKETTRSISTAVGEGAVTDVGEAGAGGATWGNVAAGVGAGLSAWDLATNWVKKTKADKTLGTIKTGLATASMIPGPHSLFTGIAAGAVGLLDMFVD